MKYLLTAGNSTMPRSVGIWNLPALYTCTPSPWCQEHCYALQYRYRWRCVREAYMERYAISRTYAFPYAMIEEICNRSSIKYVRVHISGDFYSIDYVKKWAMIARQCSNILFRTNTKRQDLLPLMVAEFPDNFVIRESIDPTREPTGLVPVAAIKGTKGSKHYFECNDNCQDCQFHCWHDSACNVVTSQVRGKK